MVDYEYKECISMIDSLCDDSFCFMEYGSPPKERIIKSEYLRPQGIGLYESTKRLIMAPDLKEDMACYRNAKITDDIFYNDLSKRFLKNQPKDVFRTPTNNRQSEENELPLPEIINGLLTSLTDLQKQSNTLKSILKCEDNKPLKLGNFNSSSALATFINITKIKESKKSIIYLAKNRFDNIDYILKSGVQPIDLKNPNLISESNLNRLRESQVMSAANHEHIVRYHSLWFEQQEFFLQMEYMIGCTLNDMWYGGFQMERFCFLPDINLFGVKITKNSAKILVQHVASALDYLHNTLKLIHNNLTASHVFACHNELYPPFDNQIDNYRTRIIRSVILGSSESVKFKIFDFSESFGIDETPVTNKSVQLDDVENLEYKDIFNLGRILAEAFMPLNMYRSINWITDDLTTKCFTSSESWNNLIKKMLNSSLSPLMTAREVLTEVENIED